MNFLKKARQQALYARLRKAAPAYLNTLAALIHIANTILTLTNQPEIPTPPDLLTTIAETLDHTNNQPRPHEHPKAQASNKPH